MLKQHSGFDYLLFSLLLIITGLSLLVLYSAGYNPERPVALPSWLNVEINSQYFFKQLVNILLATAVCLFFSFLPKKLLLRLVPYLYAVTIGLLVFIVFAGQTTKGSARWIPLGSFRFQPSELAKVVVLLMLGLQLAKTRQNVSELNLRYLLKPAFLVFLPSALILIQPDLGTTLSVLFMSVALLLFFGISRPIFYSCLAALSVLVPMFWFFGLKPYQKNRILTLFNPEADPFGQGYHIIQSKIAIGSGQISGKGFLEGTQTQLKYLPENHTDFIFAVLAEEWGMIGCVILLCLYLALCFRLLSYIRQSNSHALAFISFGAAALIAEQVFINVGMVVGILPVVGLPLPLFSYGGSALLVNFMLFGIILNLRRRESLT